MDIKYVVSLQLIGTMLLLSFAEAIPKYEGNQKWV